MKINFARKGISYKLHQELGFLITTTKKKNIKTSLWGGVFLSLKQVSLVYGNKKNKLDASIRGKRQIQSLDVPVNEVKNHHKGHEKNIHLMVYNTNCGTSLVNVTGVITSFH